jgi:hypothetical protein
MVATRESPFSQTWWPKPAISRPAARASSSQGFALSGMAISFNIIMTASLAHACGESLSVLIAGATAL